MKRHEPKKNNMLSLGESDERITFVGKYLRRSKLDELPQLINVILGDMNLVGPRPELRQFVELYDLRYLEKILSVKPGIISFASIEYYNEEKILSNKEYPYEYYINEILPKKNKLDVDYINSYIFFRSELSVFVRFLRIVFRLK